MKPLTIVQEIYAAFGDGDTASIIDTLAPDAIWEVAGRREDYPMFGRRQGIAGAFEFFRLLEENEAFSVFRPTAFHASGETVVVEGCAALTLRKTGRPAAYDWVHIWTVRDNRITRFKEFYDTAQVVEAYRAQPAAA